jgi:N-sulfoglucosamine sulfohydrolase
MQQWEQTRRDFLTRMAAGTVGLGFAAHASGATPQRKPNVLVYVVDDLGTDDAGCYGHPVLRTPGIDRIAAEGTRFTRARATTASCSASRSCILSGKHNHATGQYGHTHGYNHFTTFDNIRTLPAILGEAGYRSMCMGKYHVAPESVYPFDHLKGGKTPLEMADACRGFITENDDQPFFLYMCTTEPHRPFKREGFDTYSPDDVVVPPYLPDTPACRRELARYYGSAERADSGLDRLISILEETGQWDNTIVLFLSDNGIAFPGAKTTAYEPGLRLPLVVRTPWQEKQGVVNDACVSWVDLTPTILDMVGATPDNYAFHGRSFAPVLEESSPNGWDECYASHTFHEITMYYPMRVIWKDNKKLIWNIAHDLPYPFASDLQASETWQDVVDRGLTHYGKRSVEAYLHRPEFELYDLDADPHEVDNLADNPDHADLLADLKSRLKDFQKRTDDPWILKWEYE